MRKFTLLLSVAALVSAASSADQKCPWLNDATAAGVLGGRVSTNTTQTYCEFVRRGGSSEWALRIEVKTIAAPSTYAAFAAQCMSDAVALRAIGNEAIACDYSQKKGQVSEQVVGRVRDQAFLVRISTNDAGLDAKRLRDKARQVAEQIAGFLF